MRNRILLTIAVLATFVGGCSTGADSTRNTTTTSTTTTSVPCEEDMPCWDCETMGNKVCAVTPTTYEDDSVDYTPDFPIDNTPAYTG
jgi:PBP1b-binding outer membrane lipoprotein LpoB